MTLRRARPHRRGVAAGFTLIELLVVLVIAGIMITIGLPALSKLIGRSKLEAQARNLSILVARARNEAVSRGLETVVLFDGDSFLAFADVDGVAAGDPPDGEFNPIAGSVDRGTDWRIGEQRLARFISVAGPSGEAAIEGLSNPGRPDQRIIFNPDGSLYSTGAIRLSDTRDNHLEVAVSPRATAQVTPAQVGRDRVA